MTDADLLIRTRRLDLHTVRPEDYALLSVDRAHPSLWVDRGFANPHRRLVDDPGPLHYRLPLVEADPAAAPYLLRMAVLRDEAVIVGSAGFHARPDAEGMIEIGLGIVPERRGLGLATELLRGMWGWVVGKPEVRTLRYTVSPGNAPSVAIISRFGFALVGRQIDEEDGPEDIYEQSADEYRGRSGA